MSIRFEFEELTYNRSDTLAPYDKLISKEKKALINKEIKAFMRKQGVKGKIVFAEVAPKGNTGMLAREGLEVSKVHKRLFGFEMEFEVQPIPTTGDIAEWYYPFYVHEGTRSPITSPKGNVLGLRDKLSGFVFTWKKEVRGQQAQPYMDEFATQMNRSFGTAQYYLGKKIEAIIKS